MASAAQIISLLQSYVDGNEQHFFAVAMQVAAQEARQGHTKLADELKMLVERAKQEQDRHKTIPINRPKGELANLLQVSYSQIRLSDIVLSDQLLSQMRRIIREHKYASRILEHGLSPRRKLMLIGPPGTGKTMTALVLAGELGLPMFQVRLDGLITKFMGETASKLRQIFDATDQTRGVYLFDEFDAIGSQRGLTNDVGEVRRILNSFLQMIEQDNSNSIVMAATNHPEILDHALFRRFDDVLQYELPNEEHILVLIRARLCNYTAKNFDWKELAAHAIGLSHAEITKATQEVIKEALINGRIQVTEDEVRASIQERKALTRRFEAVF